MIKTVLPLSMIISMRFLGLFLVLPVISIYALQMENATTTLVGIVVGGYALTQMIFQVPFGFISDKFGRKSTIIVGLLIFALGSIICALSTDIYSLIFGRFLQGAGAIGAVVTAMIGDLVIEEKRAKAMAFMGASIAMSFALAMVLGPTLGAWAGVNILFWFATFLALISIIILIKKVPNPPKIVHEYHKKSSVKSIILNQNLTRMHITNFLQKGLMTFAFMIIPIVLTKDFEWQLAELWKVYIPAMIAGVLAMGPAAVFAEKKGKFKEVLLVGIVLFLISYLIIGSSESSTLFILGVVIFFAGFNMHEPIMQSLATKYAKVHQKGFVLGVFNSFGYFGTFLGGLLGGIFLDQLDISQITYAISIICVLWLILMVTLPNPKNMKTLYLDMDEVKKDNFSGLSKMDEINEWYINETENIIIIKYSSLKTDKDKIIKYLSE